MSRSEVDGELMHSGEGERQVKRQNEHETMRRKEKRRWRYNSIIGATAQKKIKQF